MEISCFDRKLVDLFLKGDNEAFWGMCKDAHYRFRVCGFSALYFILSSLKIKGGKIIDYGVWKDRGSAVSYFATGFNF